MRNLIWLQLAKLLAWAPIADWLIRRAQRTPYFHLDGYMQRWWVLNPYDSDTHIAKYRWFPWSIRVHRILREDRGRHLHDHPWNARTIVLRGWYRERRLHRYIVGDHEVEYLRLAGTTAVLKHNDPFDSWHTIDQVSPGGVFTLFITGPKQGPWGFLVDGVKVHWRQYLAQQEKAA